MWYKLYLHIHGLQTAIIKTSPEGWTHQWPWSRSMHLAQLDPWRQQEAWKPTRHNPWSPCLRLNSGEPFPLGLQAWCLHGKEQIFKGDAWKPRLFNSIYHTSQVKFIHVHSIHGICVSLRQYPEASVEANGLHHLASQLSQMPGWNKWQTNGPHVYNDV